MKCAELIVLGPTYTVDAARSWTDAAAVRGDRIIALGRAACEVLRGPDTRVIDASDGLVLPGFQDAHVHPPFAGRNLCNVDLSGLEGRDAYLAAISTYARDHPDRPWIVGGGWAMEHFPGGIPDRRDLDAVVPDRPVFLFNRDVHGAWVNSAALAAGGIDRDTADPLDGRIERDSAGDPSGCLHEGAAYSFDAEVVPAPGEAEWCASILVAQKHLHALGITGWQDAWVTPATHAAYESLAASGALTARVVGALWWDRHRGIEQIDELISRRRVSGRFGTTTVKIMVDGVLENGTGALLEPYCCGGPGGDAGSGLVYVDPGVLREAVTTLDGLGFQVHMHAIGDKAVRMALDAVEAARDRNGSNDNRHHIAHLQVVQPVDLPRFRELGVVVNAQAYWAQSEPQMDELTLPFLGPERGGMQYPFGSLHRLGATLAMGSDWGVTTADPLQQIEVAVTRIDPENRGNSPFLIDEAITLPAAVAAFTAGSAYVNHDDDGGSISIGQRADLAVLSRNIFDTGVLPGDAHVTHTVAGGAVVWDQG